MRTLNSSDFLTRGYETKQQREYVIMSRLHSRHPLWRTLFDVTSRLIEYILSCNAGERRIETDLLESRTYRVVKDSKISFHLLILSFPQRPSSVSHLHYYPEW